MEKRSQSLWDNREIPNDLRLPSKPPDVLLKEESAPKSSGDSSSSFASVSRLSVDAPEFYPSYYKAPATAVETIGVSAVQDRLKKHKISANNQGNSSSANHSEYSPTYNEFIDSPDDNRLKHLIVTLTKDAGQFADLLDIFMDTLSPYFGDVLVLSRAAQLLVNQAIDFPSFRYTGARLCCFIEQYCPEFRAELHLTCKKELQNNANKSGLLLFVAELYTQLHHENIYGTYLIEAYKHLLVIGGNENVKSVCQALKLTGYSLELYDKKALDEVFIKLTEVKPTVTGTSLSLINSVINLRGSKWGHTSPTNSGSSIEFEPPYWNDTQHPVFYNTDGSKFTSEESDFLAANMTLTEEYLTDGSDPDELCDPEPEMDEEIQAAFRDFVKLSKR